MGDATSVSSPGASRYHAYADAAEHATGDEDGTVRSRRKQGQHGQDQLESSQQGGRKAPQFMISSASTSIDIPSGAPAWRVMVGNLAAGATAGCAVEAGEPAVPSCWHLLSKSLTWYLCELHSAWQAPEWKKLPQERRPSLCPKYRCRQAFVAVLFPVSFEWSPGLLFSIQPCCAGLRAGRRLPSRACRAAALYPIDTIKTRLQLARTGGGVGALLRSGGGKALYAGVFGNLVGVAPPRRCSWPSTSP